MSEKISNNNVGIAGEFYIAHVLAKHNFKVNVTLGRTRGFDLFVQNPSGVNITISIKTRYPNTAKSFIMSKNADTLMDKYLFYAFVKLNAPDGIPEFWIVPSTIVAPLIKKSHEIWMERTAKDGTSHKDNPLRQFPIIPRYTFPENWQEQLEQFKGNVKILEELE